MISPSDINIITKVYEADDKIVSSTRTSILLKIIVFMVNAVVIIWSFYNDDWSLRLTAQRSPLGSPLGLPSLACIDTANDIGRSGEQKHISVLSDKRADSEFEEGSYDTTKEFLPNDTMDTTSRCCILLVKCWLGTDKWSSENAGLVLPISRPCSSDVTTKLRKECLFSGSSYRWYRVSYLPVTPSEPHDRR